jgi:hypothetical protein
MGAWLPLDAARSPSGGRWKLKISDGRHQPLALGGVADSLVAVRCPILLSTCMFTASFHCWMA